MFGPTSLRGHVSTMTFMKVNHKYLLAHRWTRDMEIHRWVPHLPPAICHSEGHRHGGPFTSTGLRLLAVPENDDLE